MKPKANDTGNAIQRACDCHVHVFAPDRFPFDPTRSYTPSSAMVNDLDEHLNALGMQRVVLVQPSVYGVDNSCLLEALAYFGRDRARGIAVINPDATSDREIDRLKKGGICGLRVNLEASPGLQRPALRSALSAIGSRAREHGLLLQIYSNANEIADALPIIEMLGVAVILDHFAGINLSGGLDEQLRSILPVAQLQNVWVKLSAPYRTSSSLSECDQLQSLTETLVRHASGKLVWGSDWPHTGGAKDRISRNRNEIEPFRKIDDGFSLAKIQSWIGDAKTVRQILEDNPSTLYGF